MSGDDRNPEDVATGSDDLYETLGVASDASTDDLNSAYRRLAREHHPDSNPSARVGDFGAVTDAYDVLRDPERRRSYDATRRHRRAAADAASGFRIPVHRQGPPSAPDTSSMPSEIELPLSFEQAALGTTATVEVPVPTRCEMCGGSGRTATAPCPVCAGAGHTVRQSGGINIKRSCDECGGSGRQPPAPCGDCAGLGRVVTVRDVKLRVPPGTDDGVVLRFAIPDEPGREVRALAHVSPHRYFGRRDRDVTLRLPVTLAEAALGAVVSVPTLQSAVAMRIPPGTPSGRTFRIRGRGVQHSEHPGDLLVTVEVVVPTELNDEQRAGLEAFAAATPSPRAHLEGVSDEPS